MVSGLGSGITTEDHTSQSDGAVQLHKEQILAVFLTVQLRAMEVSSLICTSCFSARCLSVRNSVNMYNTRLALRLDVTRQDPSLVGRHRIQ